MGAYLSVAWRVAALTLGMGFAASAQTARKVDPVPLRIDTAALVAAGDALLTVEPRTITAIPAPRSTGGAHDYFSEGPYWWPDPERPDGPYIRRDGERNPDRFDDHRDALTDFKDAVSGLTAAYLLTDDARYAHRAAEHLAAWFVTPATRMNPSLVYGQAIPGLVTGRGIGIIDTRRLVVVAEATRVLAGRGMLTGDTLAGVRGWFGAYGTWLTTHPYGVDERDHPNNHSTWWGAQLAAYALASGRDELLAEARAQFPRQLAVQLGPEGTFTDELTRTRPYHYTAMILDGWTAFARLASGPGVDLWNVDAGHGTIRRAVDWFTPYLLHPAAWPYPSPLEPDLEVERRDFLVDAARGYEAPIYRDLWNGLAAGEYGPASGIVISRHANALGTLP